MKRQLGFETLDSRLCMAFGDIDTNFAQNGEYSVSYESDRRGVDDVYRILELPDGLMFFSKSQAGSGPVVTIAKTDFNGELDSSFGIGGLIRVTDPKSPILQMGDAIQLTNGTFVLQLREANDSTTLVGVKPDGTVETSFGDAGYLRLGFKALYGNATIIANPTDGFFVVQSFFQDGAVTKYTASGMVDATYAQGGSFVFPGIVNFDAAVDGKGEVSVVGLRVIEGTFWLTSIHLKANGSPDESFGVGGIRSSATPVTFSYPFIDEANGSIFFWQDKPSPEPANAFLLAKYSSNLTPDASFGDSGRAVIVVPGLTAFSPTITPDRNGGLLLSFEQPTRPGLDARTVIIAKITATGVLDSTYGSSGIARHDSPVTGGTFGTKLDSSGSLFKYGFYVAKFAPDGSVDKSFGNGGYLKRDLIVQSQRIVQLQLLPHSTDGMTVVSGWPGFTAPNPYNGKATSFRSSGSQIGEYGFGGINTQFALATPSSDGGWFTVSYITENEIAGIAIRKFLSTGIIDSTFGIGDKQFVATGAIDDIRIHTARDGSVTVATANWLTESDPATSLGVAVVVRLTPSGALDSSFGSGGILRLYQKTGNLVDVMHDAALGTAVVFYNAGSSTQVSIRVFDATGAALRKFGNQGESKFSVLGFQWSSGAIDEFGRLLFVVSPPINLLSQQPRLYQVEPSGALRNSFGNGGSLALPLEFNYAFSNIDLAVRHGIIAVAGTNSFDSAMVRLLAFDYAGKPMTELGSGGFRDYELSTHGESVKDLQFADDGSLWLAISDRSEFNTIGKVLRLGASTAAPKHNWSLALDVSGDKKISPLDALQVINRLQSPVASPSSMPDTNGDAVISPIDALLVINWLNKISLGAGEGEQQESEVGVDSRVDAVDFLFTDFDDFSNTRKKNRG